jgi:hypothetical protein
LGHFLPQPPPSRSISASPNNGWASRDEKEGEQHGKPFGKPKSLRETEASLS